MARPWLWREKNFAIFCSLSKVIKVMIKWSDLHDWLRDAQGNNTWHSWQEDCSSMCWREMLKCRPRHFTKYNKVSSSSLGNSGRIIYLIGTRDLFAKTSYRNILWPKQGGSFIAWIHIHGESSWFTIFTCRSAWSTHASKAKSCKKNANSKQLRCLM